MNKRTAVYCRVAQADADSISSQRHRLLQYAADNGYDDCICYCDNGESGLTLDRPEMQKLIKDIRENAIDGIIVLNLSRVARSYVLVSDWFNFLADHTVGFISVNDNLRIDGKARRPFNTIFGCL